MPTPNDEIEHYTPDVTTWPYLGSSTQTDGTSTTTTPIWLEEHVQAELLARAIALLDELRGVIQQMRGHG